MKAQTYQRLRMLATAFLVASVRMYQLLLRPMLPSVCRFQPSCSEYFIQAVRRYGPLAASGDGHNPGPSEATSPPTVRHWGCFLPDSEQMPCVFNNVFASLFQ